MKITRLPLVAVGLLSLAALSVGMSTAPAQVAVQIGGGPPPPPPGYYHEHRWMRPGPGAVWIRGENYWRDGAWAWTGGYWTYPPYPGAIWVYGHYHRGYWHPAHWTH